MNPVIYSARTGFWSAGFNRGRGADAAARASGIRGDRRAVPDTAVSFEADSDHVPIPHRKRRRHYVLG